MTNALAATVRQPVRWRRYNNHNRFLKNRQQQAIAGRAFAVTYTLVLEPVILYSQGVRSWQILAVWLITFGPASVGLAVTTIYLHRYLTHGSARLERASITLARVIIFVTSGMRPREWRAVHKKHHAHPDVEGDPHSPVLFGFWMVFLLTAYLYKYELNRAGEEIERYLKQTPPDKLDRIVLDHGMAGPWVILPILQISGLYLVFGHALWGHHSNLIFVVWIVGLGFFLMGGGYINAIGHTARVASLNPRVGYSRNITLFPWVFRLIKVAWGEELHKNHHEHEGSAKFSPYWWEDPGFCILIFLQLIGQASDIHVAKEMQRPIRS